MKADLRKHYKAQRNALENRHILSEKIAKRLFTLEEYKTAEVLLLYYSVGSEVSTLDIMKKAFSDGKRLALPLCTDADGSMEFYYINSENDLIDEMYSIKAPDKTRCEKYTYSENSLCLVPGLAFDLQGYRLGYGKGYYDRFLSGFKGVSAGLCFDKTVNIKLPHDIHDKKTDLLITDKKVYKF